MGHKDEGLIQSLDDRVAELEAFRQRIIDAACLRDDASDDEIVVTVRRLASPSGEG